MIPIPDIETKSQVEIKTFQEIKLKENLSYLSEKSPFYKNHFLKHRIDISKIQKLEDLIQIPVTTKDDIQLNNDAFICVPKSEIIDYVTTSGTLGDPVTFVLTEADLDRLAYNEAISFACAGVTSDDVLQLMTTIDRRFMAGMAYFLGARKLGAGIIRVGAGIPELQWDSIKKFKPTYLIGVPSFLLKLIEYAHQHQINLDQSGVTSAICIGEAVRNDDFTLNTLGKKITEHWNINLYSTYASTEMSTAFTECTAQHGGHLHPELIIAEILDDNNKPVNPGDIGELTITTLGIEAMPLLRFKTGDMLQTYSKPCSCGRTTPRLGPIVGRKKQMIKYKGTTLYPPAMKNILNHFNDLECFIIEISHNAIGTDEIRIKIASQNPSTILLNQIKDHFRAKLRVTPKIEWCDKKTIDALRFPKLSRKPLLVIDKRN